MRLLTAGAVAILAAGCVTAESQGASAPITIQKQGSFAVGGKVLGDPDFARASMRYGLDRGYPVYIWDGPHVGRANWGCTPNIYEPGTGRDQQNFVAWRFGAQYPNWFEGVQFPTKDPEAWNQASRARYLEFDTIENAQMQSDAAAKLMDRIGPSVALTNSAGGNLPSHFASSGLLSNISR